MRSLLLATLLLAASARSQEKIARLDGKIISGEEARRIADAQLDADSVAGAQLAILNKGRVVWTHAYGFRDFQNKLPMTPDSNIWAASITKSVFATWVMQQAEQHRIDLDQPLAKMLSRPLSEYGPYKDSATEIINDPNWQLVTPRFLLAHTSGLANFIAYNEPDHKLRLHFKPGSRFAYSGEGLNLLQFVLEQKLNGPLDIAMQQDLFTPLKMSRTGMVWHEEFATDLALRYDAHGKYIGTTHRDHARAAGSMATTVNDLARFTEALLAGSLLRPSTQAQMFAPQIRIDAAHRFPTLATATSAEGPLVGLAYGVGWGLLTRTPYGPAFFKEGHGDGAENYVICFTSSGTCMLLLTNSDNGELAFRPLLQKLLGDSSTPWDWEGYTRESILRNEEHSGH